MRSTSRQSWQREERDHLTIREVLHVLWGHRVLVLGVVLGFVFASVVFSLARDTVYEAEATISIQSEGELSSGEDSETFVNEVFGEVDTPELRRKTMQQAGWSGSESEFERNREVQALVQQAGGGSGLLVRFSSSTAEEAAGAANTYAELFVERVTQLNQRLAGGTVPATASVQSEAVVPEQPSSPRPLLYALAAAGAGLLIGGAASLVIESRAQSWRGARDAELTLRAPVLGVIPEYLPEEEEH